MLRRCSWESINLAGYRTRSFIKTDVVMTDFGISSPTYSPRSFGWMRRIRKTVQALIALVLVASIGGTAPAEAQRIVDVEGPADGETTHMLQSPRPLGDDVLIRPLAVTGPDGTRCAFMLKGVDEGEAVTLMADEAPVEVEHTKTTTDAPRTVSVYVSPRSFLDMAHAASAVVTVGGEQYELSSEMKSVLKDIHARL